MDSVSQEVIIIAFLSLFIMVIVIAIISLILIYQKKQIKFIKEKDSLKALHENEILQAQLEIQENTLKNISQEVHDNIGQVLSLVKLNINTMDYQQPEMLQQKISDSRALITKAIQDLRSLSKSLHTDFVIESGLATAIQYELDMIKKTSDYDIRFQKEGKPYRIEDQHEVIIFRIVQEAIHNIIKHAKATEIEVKLTFEQELFTLKIIDNGLGFDASPLKNNNYSKSGIGIRNMYNRANMINSDLKIASNPGKGTTIVLTLPLQTPKM